MKVKRAKLTVAVIGILMVVLISSPLVPSSAEVKDEYIILFDRGHGQWFSRDNMSRAFKALEEVASKFNTRIKVLDIDENFTSTNLQGADLLVMTNPSVNASINNEEKDAVKTFVKEGGNILYLGNPLAKDQNITGNPLILNDLMNEKYQNFGAFHEGTALDKNSATVLVDEIHNDGKNESYVKFRGDSINNEAIISGVNTVNEVLFYGSGLRDGYQGSRSQYSEFVLGNVSSTTYYVNDKYNPQFQNIYWMIGRQMKGALGRTLSIGSTIMFSDLMYDNTTQTRWIDTANNKELFQNIIAWLLQLTPIVEVEPIVEEGLSPFVFIGLTLLFSVILFTLVFGINILKGRIQLSQVFYVKSLQKEIKKKRKKAKAEGEAAKKKKKKKKKKKRT